MPEFIIRTQTVYSGNTGNAGVTVDVDSITGYKCVGIVGASAVNDYKGLINCWQYYVDVPNQRIIYSITNSPGATTGARLYLLYIKGTVSAQ